MFAGAHIQHGALEGMLVGKTKLMIAVHRHGLRQVSFEPAGRASIHAE